jgi:hypothetical protein
MRAAKDLEKIGRNRDIPRGENMGGGKYGGENMGIAPRKLGKGGRDVENNSETFQ